MSRGGGGEWGWGVGGIGDSEGMGTVRGWGERRERMGTEGHKL